MVLGYLIRNLHYFHHMADILWQQDLECERFALKAEWHLTHTHSERR